MKKLFLIALLLIVLYSSSIYALSLNGNRLSPIIFEPGKKVVNHYIVEGTDKEVKVSLGGDLLQYVQVTEVVDNQFDLIIEVPENLPEPGSYWFSLQASEVGNEKEAGVGSLLSVSLRFLVEVPPHGKSISLSLDIPDVNEHEAVPIMVNIASKGLENISSLSGEVIVYDSNNHSAATLNLKGKPLPALESTILSVQIPADQLSPAKYWAEAVITYDGKVTRAQDGFKIGDLDLFLINYTSQLEQGFSQFKATVENNWGNPLQIVYLKVSIEGNELLTTPTVLLGPWQRGELAGILKTDFEPGNYAGSIQLFYDGLSKTEEVVFTITEPAETARERSTLILVISGISAIAAILVLFLLFGKKIKNKK